MTSPGDPIRDLPGLCIVLAEHMGGSFREWMNTPLAEVLTASADLQAEFDERERRASAGRAR